MRAGLVAADIQIDGQSVGVKVIDLHVVGPAPEVDTHGLEAAGDRHVFCDYARRVELGEPDLLGADLAEFDPIREIGECGDKEVGAGAAGHGDGRVVAGEPGDDVVVGTAVDAAAHRARGGDAIVAVAATDGDHAGGLIGDLVVACAAVDGDGHEHAGADDDRVSAVAHEGLDRGDIRARLRLAESGDLEVLSPGDRVEGAIGLDDEVLVDGGVAQVAEASAITGVDIQSAAGPCGGFVVDAHRALAGGAGRVVLRAGEIDDDGALHNARARGELEEAEGEGVADADHAGPDGDLAAVAVIGEGYGDGIEAEGDTAQVDRAEQTQVDLAQVHINGYAKRGTAAEVENLHTAAVAQIVGIGICATIDVELVGADLHADARVHIELAGVIENGLATGEVAIEHAGIADAGFRAAQEGDARGRGERAGDLPVTLDARIPCGMGRKLGVVESLEVEGAGNGDEVQKVERGADVDVDVRRAGVDPRGHKLLPGGRGGHGGINVAGAELEAAIAGDNEDVQEVHVQVD